jgi:hypothetical protein
MLSTSTLTTKKKATSKKAATKKAATKKAASKKLVKKKVIAFEDFSREGDDSAPAPMDDDDNDNFGMNDDDYSDLPPARSSESPETKRLSFSSATNEEETKAAVKSRFANTKRARVSKATEMALEAGKKTNTVMSATSQSAAELPNIASNVTPVEISSTDAPASAAQQAAAAANLSNVVETDEVRRRGEEIMMGLS